MISYLVFKKYILNLKFEKCVGNDTFMQQMLVSEEDDRKTAVSLFPGMIRVVVIFPKYSFKDRIHEFILGSHVLLFVFWKGNTERLWTFFITWCQNYQNYLSESVAKFNVNSDSDILCRKSFQLQIITTQYFYHDQLLRSMSSSRKLCNNEDTIFTSIYG